MHVINTNNLLLHQIHYHFFNVDVEPLIFEKDSNFPDL